MNADQCFCCGAVEGRVIDGRWRCRECGASSINDTTPDDPCDCDLCRTVAATSGRQEPTS